MNPSAAIVEVADNLEGSKYSEDPEPTKFGIEQSTFDTFRIENGIPRTSIKNIQRSDVILIYDKYFWIPLKCSQLPDGVDFVVFQLGVNIGAVPAAMILQEIVGTKQDGEIGPKTLAAVKTFPPQQLIDSLLSAQEEHYKYLAKANPARNEKYLSGWLNRVEKVRDFVAESTSGESGLGAGDFLLLLLAFGMLALAVFLWRTQ